jgi:two-component system phosphate regulon sensor histidine kinase PhoR
MQRVEAKVLLVDRSRGRREALRQALAGKGLAADVADSVDTAIQRLATIRFDLVVLELGDEVGEHARVADVVERQGGLLLAISGTDDDAHERLLHFGARERFAPDADADTIAAATHRWALRRIALPRIDSLERELKRVKVQYEDLRRHLSEQVNAFEESQEAFYLDLSRMMTIVGNIMDGIVFADPAGDIALLNPVAENLLGIRAFLAIGKPVGELTGPRELVKTLQEDHRTVLDRKEVVRTIEVHHSEQDLLYIKAHTTKVLDYRGAFAGILTVLQDVTAEFKSDQLKNQYLSIVAHELRTPLTGIKTFSSVMAKGALGPLNERQRDVVESIREQSLRLEHQIDKLINLGQLDSADFAQDLEDFDVHEFLQSAVAPFEQAAKDRVIGFTAIYPESGVRVRADRTDLRRALQALIENAIKFTPDRGEVVVAAEVQDGKVWFRVRDSGIGIDPRYHRRIFEKFFQVEDPLTRHHGGAGLGLFVARGIIEAHGSRIEVRSALGQGSEFSFQLPALVGAGRNASAAEQPVAGAAAHANRR